jgi:hypothetical protein
MRCVDTYAQEVRVIEARKVNVHAALVKITSGQLPLLGLTFSVSPIAALRLAPKEDFTLNAKPSTLNCFMRRGWNAALGSTRVQTGALPTP